MANKNTLCFLLVAFCALFVSSCNDGKTTTADLSKNGRTSAGGRKQLTDNPQPPPSASKSDQNPRASAEQAKQKQTRSAKPAQAEPENITAANSPTSRWSLVLGTFTDLEHASSAAQMINQLRTVAPQLTGASVHTTPRGSMVIYGNYSGRDDPAAKADQDQLKEITFQGRKVFNRISLTRLDLRLTQGEFHPHDLLSARKLHPKVDPLYTLDVAIWDDFDNAKITYDEIRRKAEAYAAQLRQQKIDAYFYHDDEHTRSIVTVGLFDRRAINSTSGLYSTEVTDLAKRFPVRLVNGEPMNELKAKYLPQLGTKPQTPVLVLVPMM